MNKKRELLDFQPIITPPTITETLNHVPWLNKDKKYIRFIKVRFLFPSNNIFNVILSLCTKKMMF